MPLSPRIGVVLLQLGGPDSLEAVEPFLFNLFCDPDIIPIPVVGGLLRKPLARWISHRRAPRVAEHYREIGGRSPIALLTERQARALDAALRPDFNPLVVVAMRYWHPLTVQAIARLRAAAVEQIVLLPLYPQFSYATTLSSLKEWNRHYHNGSVPVRTVGDFHRHPLYIAAIVERIRATFRHFDSPEGVHLLFSAHGVPLSLVQKGDPYPKQIETTVSDVLLQGSWQNPHTLCFQSKVGPMKWLEPSLTATLARLGHEGVKKVLIVPLSFVTEHVETLHEINLEAREEARHAGIEQFRMMPAVGASPTFVACLADLVRAALSASS
jgi:ferrochelatase